MRRLIGWLLQAKPSGGDPNDWCKSTCDECGAPCSGNAGHNGPHKCFSHG